MRKRIIDRVFADPFSWSATDGGGNSPGGGSGGGSGGADDVVTFIDYDGTVLYSYTTADAQALTELPPLPEHEGLICQGWNYDLATIKEYNCPVTVGAMYTTDDGKTRIYITLQEGRTSPRLCIYPKGTVTVDWGDGTTPDTLTGTNISYVRWTPVHEYSAPGDYVISLTIDGTAALRGKYSDALSILNYTNAKDDRNSIYHNAITKVQVGDNVAALDDGVFYTCICLKDITIPSSVTSIGQRAFSACYSLTGVVVPSNVTSVSVGAISSCTALSNVSLPAGITDIGDSAFGYNGSLRTIRLPLSVTSIGSNAFDTCISLQSIRLPAGVTSIGEYAFNSCVAFVSITLPEGITSIAQYTFCKCHKLRSIVIPDSVTSIGASAFDECYVLQSIAMPNKLASIGKYAFRYCYALPNIVLPESFTSLGHGAFIHCRGLSFVAVLGGLSSFGDGPNFQYCYGVGFYDFTKYSAVPTLGSTSVFYKMPDDCEFRVPAALYDEWIAAEIWSEYASQIVAA